VWPGQVSLPLEAVIAKAASLGFDGLMIMAKRPHASILDMTPDARATIRGLLTDNSLALACLAAYNDMTEGAVHPDVPFREMQVHYITELARLTHDLGGSVIRVFTGYEKPNVPYWQQWQWCVQALKECARRAADFGVTIAVQNHHDIANHYLRLHDLLSEISEPNCKAAFDAWAPALHGADLAEAVRHMGDFIVHTTAADYVKRPRFQYDPGLVNFIPQPDLVQAVPIGEGFIDYKAFFSALKDTGYDGFVAYEMCSPLKGGGSEQNLNHCAHLFLDYMKTM
jgi:sugar phosphate isomerase/epimerase